MDHASFRDQLAFSIGFALSRSRDLLRRILKEHAPDDARQMVAARVLEHLEQSGFEIDEAEQVIRKRPPTSPHRTLGGVVRYSVSPYAAEQLEAKQA